MSQQINTAQQPQPSGFFNRFWNSTKSVLSTAGTATYSGLATTASGIGSVANAGINKTAYVTSRPAAWALDPLQQTINQVLPKQPPQELFQLREQLAKLLAAPNAASVSDIKQIHDCMKILHNDNWKLLKELASKINNDGTAINEEGIKLFQVMFDFFKYYAAPHDNTPEAGLKEAKEIAFQNAEFIHLLRTLQEAFNTILDGNQGKLVEWMNYIKQGLLSEEHGVLTQSLELLQTTFFGQSGGSIALGRRQEALSSVLTVVQAHSTDADRRALEQMSQLTKLLSSRLTAEEAGNILDATTLLRGRGAGSAPIDEQGVRTILVALNTVREKYAQVLHSGLDLLKDELNTAMPTLLRHQVTGTEGALLQSALQLLNTPREYSAEEKAQLLEALQLLANRMNEDKVVIFGDGIRLLKKWVTPGEGLDPAILLLEHKRNGVTGISENLLHRLQNEHDVALTQALDVLHIKLVAEKSNILQQAISLFQRRLTEDADPAVPPEKKLTAGEQATFANALDTLQKAKDNRDSLHVWSPAVEAAFAEVFAILEHKSLNALDQLSVRALKLTSETVAEEKNLLDSLNTSLNDPKAILIAKSIDTLHNKLLEESGPLRTLQKKLLNQNEEVHTQAIDLLNRKLNQLRNPTAGSRTQVIDERGVFDALLKLLEGKLTIEDKDLLIKTRNYFSGRNEGMLNKMSDWIDQKLQDVQVYLTDEDTGILKQLSDHVTRRSHPLLANARKKLRALQDAITTQNKADIKKLSQEAQRLLEQIVMQPALIFTKKPLSTADLAQLTLLKDQLSAFYTDTPPHDAQMLQNVGAGLTAVEPYYTSLEGVAARTGTAIEESLIHATNAFSTHLEEKVKRAGQSLMEMVEGATVDTPSQPDEGTVSQFLKRGAKILKTMLDKGAQAISQMGLSAFSNVFIIGLKAALQKMGTSEAFDAPRGVLNGIIQHLEHPLPIADNLSPEQLIAARQNDPDAFGANGRPLDSFSTLINRFNRAADLLKSVKIYVNGFRVPFPGRAGETGSSVEGAFLDNTTALRNVIGPTTPPPSPQDQNWKVLAEEEKNKLIDNTTQYLTLKHIYEDVCGLKPINDHFYLELLKRSKAKETGDEEGLTPSDKLKKIFFEKLSENKVSFRRQLWAKFLYSVGYGFFVRRYVSKASTIYFKDIFNYIEKHKEEKFNTLRNQLTKNFTRYLVILGGAYRTVANSREDGLPEEMLKKELEKPESNLKFDTKELYLEFAKVAIKKTVGSGPISWIAKRIIGDPEIIVRSIVDKATGALQDNHGYTHALNSVIREQLEEIWNMLQTEQARRQNNPNIDSEANLSDVRKDELSSLVKNLFEILGKSKCQTLSELRDLISGKLLSANVNKAIDDLFIEEVIGKVTNIIAVSIQSLIKEDQLQKLTYKFASLANRSFEVGEQCTLDEMNTEERKISKLCSQILQTSVETAVAEKFDFNGNKQQTESNRYVSEMHQLFFGDSNYRSVSETPNLRAGYKRDLEGNLATLATMDFTTDAGKIKIKRIADDTLAFETECSAASFQAKSSWINYDNKNEINLRYLGIAEKSKPLVQAVVQMKQHANTLDNLQVVVPKLNAIKTIINGIPLLLFRPGGATADDFTTCGNQLKILEEHLKELRALGHLTHTLDQIMREVPNLAIIILDVKKASQTRAFCTTLAQPTSLLTQVANDKKQHLANLITASQLQNKFDSLRQEMRTAFDDTVFAQLSIKLQAIEKATLTQQVDTAYQEFMTIANQALAQATITFDASRLKYWTAHGLMDAAINGSGQLDPNIAQTARTGIQHAIAQAQQHLQTLNTWAEKEIKAILYRNFSLPLLNVEGLQDLATGLVYGRVKERLDGLMKLLRREETYRYGILNHLALIPYIQEVRAPKP